MSGETGLLSSAWRIVTRNKRYIFWFWLLNITLAEFGTAAYRNSIHEVLDNSLYADRLLHGFNLITYFDLLARPETGSLMASEMPAMYFALLFMVATIFLMPGVFRQYTSEYRVSKEEFYRTCGKNLWRFVRLLLIYAVIAAPLAAILFGIRRGLLKLADKSTSELLPVYVGLIGLIVIFLIMTLVRVWFDLAEVDVVVRDQPLVRKSVGAGWRYSRRFWVSLLGAYVGISVLALLVLVVGVWVWHMVVPASSWIGALIISQAMLILWLCARFWQRAVAAEFHLREMLIAPPASRPLSPEPVGAASPAGALPSVGG